MEFESVSMPDIKSPVVRICRSLQDAISQSSITSLNLMLASVLSASQRILCSNVSLAGADSHFEGKWLDSAAGTASYASGLCLAEVAAHGRRRGLNCFSINFESVSPRN
jgi:hypothetical protein